MDEEDFAFFSSLEERKAALKRQQMEEEKKALEVFKQHSKVSFQEEKNKIAAAITKKRVVGDVTAKKEPLQGNLALISSISSMFFPKILYVLIYSEGGGEAKKGVRETTCTTSSSTYSFL